MMEGRRDKLLRIVGDDPTAVQLVDEVVFLEEQLVELKKLPFIKVHPSDPSKQKTTPAAKQYKELLQQYNNSMRLLIRITGAEAEEEESPLRKWMNEHINSTKNHMDS